MEQHGDAKLTDLLQTLATCPKRARPASTIGASGVRRAGRIVQSNEERLPFAACSAALLASRRLVAPYPCPDKGDQAKADDPCGDDDPSDSHAVEYDGLLGDCYTRDPYKLPHTASCSPRPNCCFFRPICSCGVFDHHPSKPRAKSRGTREFQHGGGTSADVRSTSSSWRSFALNCARRRPSRELLPSRPGDAVRGRHRPARSARCPSALRSPEGFLSPMRRAGPKPGQSESAPARSTMGVLIAALPPPNGKALTRTAISA